MILSFNSTIARLYDLISRLLIKVNISSILFLLFDECHNIMPLTANATPAIVHPTGPARPNKASPAVIPPPPAISVPPPSHANAALVAAAPLNVEMAVPVEATPKVVAIPIAAVGPIVATATPALTPAAPAPAFLTVAAL